MHILYVSTVAVTMGFFSRHIQMLQEAGHKVDLACSLEQPLSEAVKALGCRTFHIPFSRSPFCKDNLVAYQRIKRLLADHHYDIVHTHTPNASALVRFACRKLRKQGVKIFYTAHGFHFYSGAPWKNWLIYYPVERFLSRWTDVLITINQEDYCRAQKFRAKKVAFVHGVGVDIERFQLDWTEERRREKRRELGLADEELMILSVGELSVCKNHEAAIRALALLRQPHIRYFICGEGVLKDHLGQLAEQLGVKAQVTLLGRRQDVGELNQAADLFLFPSRREGLPVALMEAMAAGNPVICSDIRGNRDLIQEGQGGILCEGDATELADAVRYIIDNPDLCRQMGRYNQQTVKNFSTPQVLEELKKIYQL